MIETQTAAAFPARQFFEGKSLASRLARQTVKVIAGSAFVAICAHVSIPLLFTPVPLTMQNFAVLLLGLLMEPVTAFASLALYLVEGASGAPVLTPHGPGGILQLFGPTGGFLLAYPLVAALTSLFARRIRPASYAAYAFSAATASLLLYLSGAGWFILLTHATPSTALRMTVLPFLPGDALKVAAAAAIASGLSTLRRQRYTGDSAGNPSV